MSLFDPFTNFCRACRNNGILLDTNMLILYIVGNLGEEFVSREKLLNSEKHKHTYAEYGILKKIINVSREKKVFFTTHTVPEVSHLLDVEQNRVIRNNGVKNCKYCESILDFVYNSTEIQLSTKKIIYKNRELVKRFGISDLSLIEAVNREDAPAILTDDMQLCDYLIYRKLPAMSLSQLNALQVNENNVLLRFIGV